MYLLIQFIELSTLSKPYLGALATRVSKAAGESTQKKKLIARKNGVLNARFEI